MRFLRQPVLFGGVRRIPSPRPTSSDTPLKLQVNRRVRLEFRGATITLDAGLLACRELDDSLGLTVTATACLQGEPKGSS